MTDSTTTGSTGFSNVRPPSFPLNAPYASCYCEENVYLLVEALNQSSPLSDDTQRQTSSTLNSNEIQSWHSYVVFVTNPTQTVLLYDQKASSNPDQGSPVVWDYHVFVLVTCTLPTSTSSPTIDELSDQFPTSPNIGVPDTPTESPDPSFSTLPRKRRPSFFKKRSKSRPDSPASPMESISAFPHPNQSQNTFLSQDFSKSTSTRVPYAWVYDFDSILSSSKSLARSSQNGNRFYPVALENYLSSTFKNLVSEQEMLNPKLNPYFRVIPSRDYLSNFSSDRSHMLIEGINPSDILATHPSSYLFPPPTWHKICGKEAFERGEEVGGNLKKWLKVNAGDQDDMGGFGKVYDFKDFHNGKWLEEMGGESNGRSKETTTRGNHRRPAPPPPDASSLPTRMRSESNSERPVGGRITSPDFPAYLASALANRAGRARGSYLGLEGQGNS